MFNEPKPPTRFLSEFKADLYLNIAPGELVVFAIQVLQNDDIPVTTEEIVSICFRLFPQSFSLKNYFYWPDSALVARRLHDVREKGYVKGSPVEGFALKVKGRQVARRVAKTLGVVLPQPKKVEVEPALPTPPVTDSVPEATTRLEAKPSVPEPSPTPEIKTAPRIKATAKKKKTAQPAPRPAEKKRQPKKTTVKTSTPASKKRKTAIKKETKQEPIRPADKKAVATPKATRSQIKSPVAQKTPPQPRQLALSMPVVAPAEKKTKEKISQASAEKEARKPVATTPAPQVSVSKEEKDKAGKVVKLMERSDAFKHYGRKTPISEFDFRNMLFATMESSAETLKRNVDLFKRYAGIHNRKDLIVFLDFCTDKFAPLLTASAKPARRLKL
ncbi:MAG TPA: hypothetical protein PKL78_14315 [Anaerolineales bacterium]|nr:hypothetical protein [Anaerolineales bacterium]